jgi:hypothetical protein
MSSYQRQKRKKPSQNNEGDLPTFLENSPFFIPFTSDAEWHARNATPKPSLAQLLRSKNAQALLGFLIGAFLFWYLMPRKGDISYEALGKWGLLHGGGAQCLYDRKAHVAIPDPTTRDGKEFEALDWEKLAYVTYVTHTDVLCNAVMLFESLNSFGSKGKRVMLIPDTEEFNTENYGSRSAQEDATVKRLLRQAETEYGVRLVRVRIVRKELSFSKIPFPIFICSTANQDFRNVGSLIHQTPRLQSNRIFSHNHPRLGRNPSQASRRALPSSSSHRSHASCLLA